MKKEKTFIIGHKNPDTDSICSAIAYADIKSRTSKGSFVARRAGQINEETEFVLKYFHMDAPAYLPDVGTQVKDMDIHMTPGAEKSMSVKRAWNLMREHNAVTLPITDKEGMLEGIITTGDIATSYMDAYDSTLLSEARTQYRSIADTLDGQVLVGNEHGYFIKGKVLVGSAHPDMMESYIESDDMVILANRAEDQLCAIENNASCLIICLGAKVSQTIQRLAAERECVIITTPYDTFTVARLIYQSIPVKYFMKKDNLITFRSDDFTDKVKEVMTKNRYRAFPVVDKRGKYIGTVSRRNLLNIKKKKLILVDHNEKSQAVDNIDEAEILEIDQHARTESHIFIWKWLEGQIGNRWNRNLIFVCLIVRNCFLKPSKQSTFTGGICTSSRIRKSGMMSGDAITEERIDSTLLPAYFGSGSSVIHFLSAIQTLLELF